MSLQRVKLFRVKTKLELCEIKQLLDSCLLQNHEYGFYSTEFHSDSKLFSVYTEKFEHTEKAYDPYGNVLDEISYVTYCSIKFHLEMLRENELILVLSSPPQSLKSFFRNFNDCLDFSAGFGSFELDLSKLGRTIEQLYSAPLSSTGKLKVSRVVIDGNSKATIEVSSSKDAFDALNKLVGSQEYYIDKLASSFRLNDKVVDFELSKTGLLRIRDDHQRYLIDAIKLAL